MKQRILIIPALVALMLLSAACLGVPKKELSAAERAIQRAAAVNAGKFAASNYTKAKDRLKAAMGFVKKDNKKARAEAILAKQLADLAFFQALQSNTDGTIKDAKVARVDADKSKASKLSSEKYQEAMQLLKEADAERKEIAPEIQKELERNKQKEKK